MIYRNYKNNKEKLYCNKTIILNLLIFRDFLVLSEWLAVQMITHVHPLSYKFLK